MSYTTIGTIVRGDAADLAETTAPGEQELAVLRDLLARTARAHGMAPA